MAEALASGMSAYFFVGFLLATWWALEAAGSPAGRLTPADLLVAWSVMIIIWPAVLVALLDSEDRWRR